MVSGVSVQVSGRHRGQPATSSHRSELRVEDIRVEHRKQVTADKVLTVFCHLISAFCFLTPDTRNLKPAYF